MNLHEQINSDIERLILDSCADIITPVSIARILLDRYAQGLEVHVQYLSLEHLKSMARKRLGKKFNDADDTQPSQGELFSGHLQKRYPLPPVTGQEPAYKILESLTQAEIDWNVEMLRRSGEARLMHADALEAYGLKHVAA